MKPAIHGIAIGCLSLALMGGPTAVLAAGQDGNAAVTQAMPAPAPAASAKEVQVRKAANQEVSKRRMSLDSEAVTANDEILHAITLLDKKDTQGAYKALETADGQLGVLLARDPHLKMAAIDVRASIIDLDTTPKIINKAVKAAKAALDDQHIQAARADLSPLVSEMHISTDYLPMEIYPDAIKKASKEIQQAKFAEAEDTLADAMASVVTVEDIIPLPPVKAEGDVLEAERLLGKDKAGNKDRVRTLLKRADQHLAIATALGYGKYKVIHNEIVSIDSQVKTSTEKSGLFERIKHYFHELDHSNKT